VAYGSSTAMVLHGEARVARQGSLALGWGV
jgi:hypothetical protein